MVLILIVGLAFRMSIPFRNLRAGVEETVPLENSRKSGYLAACLFGDVCRKTFWALLIEGTCNSDFQNIRGMP
jgi:hypothetical protein